MATLGSMTRFHSQIDPQFSTSAARRSSVAIAVAEENGNLRGFDNNNAKANCVAANHGWVNNLRANLVLVNLVLLVVVALIIISYTGVRL